MGALCRDCLRELAEPAPKRCPSCRSPRIIAHPELDSLSIAHIDCDAFYASIEKRDNPDIADKPVIVGGGRRGVVSTCCYIARTYGVKSAMPMFKALDLCPSATVIRPDIRKYAEVSREIRDMMMEVTPLVEPLSLDEAFLDLTGTERLHKATPAMTLARLSKQVEDKIGITVSVGLSFNKFLAKIASDIDKPRGMKVIGREDAIAFLEPKPVTLLPGVGKAFAASLSRDGIFTIGDVRRRNPKELAGKFGNSGLWIWNLSNAQDSRTIETRAPAKAISAETTLETDTADPAVLSDILWRLCEKVSARAKAAEKGGKVVQLKLKTVGFKITTRRQSLERPTRHAHRIFETASRLLGEEANGARYRLIGVGISEIVPESQCDEADLIDTKGRRRDAAEDAMDKVRAKFGSAVIRKGRSLQRREDD
jgi:DNA polymerase-4